MPSTVPEMNKRVFADYVQDCGIIDAKWQRKGKPESSFQNR